METESNEITAPDPTPATAPMTYAELYVALRDLLGAHRSFCLNVETWHHAYGGGRADNIVTTWMAYVCNNESGNRYDAKNAAELLDQVRAAVAAEPVDPIVAPEDVQAVGEVPANPPSPLQAVLQAVGDNARLHAEALDLDDDDDIAF